MEENSADFNPSLYGRCRLICQLAAARFSPRAGLRFGRGLLSLQAFLQHLHEVDHIAGGFGLGGAESYPGVFGAFAGFADDARLEDGYLKLPDRPGIGFEGQAALYRIMRDLAA